MSKGRRTCQTERARKLLKSLNIDLRSRKNHNGVFVRCKKYRRSYFDERLGYKRFFYELGSAFGTVFNEKAATQIVMNEDALLDAGVSITYWVMNGRVFSVDLQFGYENGTVRIEDVDKTQKEREALLARYEEMRSGK